MKENDLAQLNIKVSKQLHSKLKYLAQMDKDMVVNIDRSERMIKDLNVLIDSLNNERSELESSNNLLDNDLEYYEKDHSRIDLLIQNNKEHFFCVCLNTF